MVSNSFVPFFPVMIRLIAVRVVTRFLLGCNKVRGILLFVKHFPIPCQGGSARSLFLQQLDAFPDAAQRLFPAEGIGQLDAAAGCELLAR